MIVPTLLESARMPASVIRSVGVRAVVAVVLAVDHDAVGERCTSMPGVAMPSSMSAAIVSGLSTLPGS